jgi:hypothetical protein
VKKWGEPINLVMVGSVFAFNAYAFSTLGAGVYDGAHLVAWVQNVFFGIAIAVVLALILWRSIARIEGFSWALLFCTLLTFFLAFIWLDTRAYRGSGDIRAPYLMVFMAIGVGVAVLSVILHMDAIRNRTRRRELERMRKARERKSLGK